jgi:hypothetical protein
VITVDHHALRWCVYHVSPARPWSPIKIWKNGKRTLHAQYEHSLKIHCGEAHRLNPTLMCLVGVTVLCTPLKFKVVWLKVIGRVSQLFGFVFFFCCTLMCHFFFLRKIIKLQQTHYKCTIPMYIGENTYVGITPMYLDVTDL